MAWLQGQRTKGFSTRVIWVFRALLVLVLLTSLSLDGNRNLRLEVAFGYDANGWVERLGLARVERAGQIEDQWLEFARDAVGHDVERSLTQNGKREGFVLRQDYDPVHRLVSQWAGLGAASPAVAAIAERQYRYDLNDNPTEVYDRHWGTSRYGYDADGRIASLTRETGVMDEYRYDASGNVQAVRSNGLRLGAERIPSFASVEERLLGPGGRLERAGGKEYLYDEDGRVIEKREGERVWKYEWTSEGHLRSVVTPKNEIWKYEYDAFGRRVRKIGPQETVTYLWDGGVVAEEIRQTRKSSTTASWYFEPGTFRPVAKVENGKAYACITDQIGTPRELVSADGEVAWSAQFTAWGEIEAQYENKVECPIRFQGQWYDEESGLHYNWNRYYEGETGRYLCPDPTGLEGGSREYGYVHNPLSWIDPLGLAGCPNDTNSATRSEAFNKAKATNGIPTSQQPDVTFKPGTPEGKAIGLDPARNGRLYEFTNSQGQKIWIREDFPASYGDPGGVGDQGPHFNAGPAGSQGLPQHHYWSGG